MQRLRDTSSTPHRPSIQRVPRFDGGVPSCIPLPLATLLLLASPTPRARADSVALCANLGNHHHQITTGVTEAQHYHQLGLRLAFGVSHAEESPALKQGAR